MSHVLSTAAGLFALAASAAFGAPASADAQGGEVVAAAPAGPSAPPTTASPSAAPAKVAPQDADDDQGPDPNDKKIHGEMSVGVGTNGYREVYGAATAPLPDGGQASIAIDASQMGPYRR